MIHFSFQLPSSSATEYILIFHLEINFDLIFQLCPFGYFTCQAGGMTCIQDSFKCDCSSDCEDGSDETEGYAGCTNVAMCSAENGSGKQNNSCEYHL